MFGGNAGSGLSPAGKQGPTGAFGGRAGGFGATSGRGFGGGTTAGGAFVGRVLFGAALPATGQGAASAPAAGGSVDGGGFGDQRSARGAAAGGPEAASGHGAQQQQQRATGPPGGRVFARLGLAALKEGAAGGAAPATGAPGGAAASVHVALHPSNAGTWAGRSRGGASSGSGGFLGDSLSGRHGGASSIAGRGGVSDAGGFGGGGRRGGRGGLGRGRNQWVRQQPSQLQPQPANGGRKVGWGLGTRAARGGTAAGGDEGMDQVHEANGEGSDEDRDGAPMEQDGEGEYDEEYDGEGDDTEVAVPVTAPGPWRGNRFTSAAQSRVPVPSFGEKSPGLDGGEGAEADDEARLRKRRQRFGPSAEVGPAAAGDGGGGRGGSTPPRPASRSPLRWHQSGSAAGGARGGGEEGEEETAPGFHRSSLSPPPSPLLPIFIGGGAGGSDALGDDDEGGGAGPALVGSCELMCPVSERKRREASGELNIFERLDPLNSKLTNENLIIKKARKNYSEEDRRPENLRTFRALGLTMARLRSLISAPDETALGAAIGASPEQTLLNVQGFLWDRYREVRKEIIAQHFHTRTELLPKVLSWNEEIARFLIISSHELWGNRDFASQLNQEQLKKVLTDLVTRFYTAAVRMGVPTPDSAEIKCYLLILMLGGTIEKNGRRFRQPAEAQMYLRQYTQEELSSPWTRVLFSVMAALQNGNVLAFFELMSRAPYTLACICASHVMPMRSLAMHIMAAAMGAPHLGQPGGRADASAAMPLSDLARLVKLSEANATSYAETRQALVQPGVVHGQRDVSFLSHQITSREPKVKARAQHWISAKRCPLGRSHDTVQPAQLSRDLLNYCRHLLEGVKGQPVEEQAGGGQRPRPLLTQGNGSTGQQVAMPVRGMTPPMTVVAAAPARPPPLSQASSSWEFSPKGRIEVSGERWAAAGSGAVGSAVAVPSPGLAMREGLRRDATGIPSGQAAAVPAQFNFGATFQSASMQGTGATTAVAPPADLAGAAPWAAAPAGLPGASKGFVTMPVGVPPPTAAAAAAVFQSSQPPPPQAGLPLQPQVQVPQQHFRLVEAAGFGFTTNAATSAATQYPYHSAVQLSPPLVDAGLLAQAQKMAEVERQARESLRYQADQAIRLEHERHRVLTVHCQQLAATAAAAQSALAEAQRREAAFTEQVVALRLDQQGRAIEELWRSVSLRRYVAQWREATLRRKRREEQLRQQLARASVTFVGARARSALDLLGRGGSSSGGDGGGNATVQQTSRITSPGQRHKGRKRRFEMSAAGGASAAAVLQRLSCPCLPESLSLSSPKAGSVTSGRNKAAALTPHISLTEVALPGLYRALARSHHHGVATPGVNSRGDLSWNGAAAEGRDGARLAAAAVSPVHVFWKILLLSGAREDAARCISAVQLEAAEWIRARLSCGRTTGMRSLRQSATAAVGEQLTLESVCFSGASHSGGGSGRGGGGGRRGLLVSATLCIHDVNAIQLASAVSVEAASGGAATTNKAAGAEAAAVVAATSGVLMLVDGREFEAALAAGSSAREAAAVAAQDLNESWQRLKMVLSCLPGVQLTPTQEPSPLPVVLLTLASEAATDAISGHLAAVAAEWEPAVAARLLQQGEQLGRRTNVAALAGNVSVASLVETPDKVLRQALSYMAESAQMYEQVVMVDLENLARGMVAEVVVEMDRRDAAVSAATTTEAFNQLAAAYEAAIQATATSPSALWGLPAPELSASDADAAPACWAPHRVRTAAAALRKLQMPPLSPTQQSLPGGSAMLPYLLGHVAAWSASLAGPRQALLLASLAPAPGRPRQLRAAVPLSLLVPSLASIHATDEQNIQSVHPGKLVSPLVRSPSLWLNGGAPVSVSDAAPGGTEAASPASYSYAVLTEDAMVTPMGPRAHTTDAPSQSGRVALAQHFSPWSCTAEGTQNAGDEVAAESKRQGMEALQRLRAALGS